ncbi:MAG TPA: peptide chain release factor N(5)-glutamine methyltransferase [Acidobacteriaceae bacterium]|jgi:release factor glutamine methyltransferase
MTLREALERASAQLDASSDLRADASRDALVLLLHMVGISRANLHADPDRMLTPTQQTAYEAAIRRRLTNEPIQYITGEQEFYGLALHVTPAVLIPRPETEHLVEAVLNELDPTAPLRILDIGTGSGAIAIALAQHLPQCSVTAVDLSPAALEVAAANAALHNLTPRIRFVESDLLDALPASEMWDAIVSNPPYVATSDRDSLHPQVRDHEPAAALFAGASGLDMYCRLIPQACAALKPNGLLALEIGHDQHEVIAGLLADWNAVYFIDDLQSIPRVALARRP